MIRSSNAQHLGAGFLTRDGDTAAKRAQAKRRRDSGCCVSCGRPMGVAVVANGAAELLCSCGRREYALRGSKQYRAATRRPAVP
jgi:hypothetical protein